VRLALEVAGIHLAGDEAGERITRARKEMVVAGPSRMKLSSAWPMRCSASCRSLPWTMTLASRES
jgi:hypothetical protein